jgi:hypothetical protein
MTTRQSGRSVRRAPLPIAMLACLLAGANAPAQTLSPLPGFVSCEVPLPPGSAGAAQPVAVISGNFNGDGIPDLAVVDAANKRVVILLSNPSTRDLFRAGDCVGAMNATQITPPNNAPIAIAAGNLQEKYSVDDLAVVGLAGISVLTNNGSGQFTAASSTISSGLSPQAVAIADVDGDSHFDIVVGSSGSDHSVTVVYGRPGGGFDTTSTAETYPAGLPVAFMSVADVNRDGALDIITGSDFYRTVYILLQNGKRTFESPLAVPIGTVPAAIGISDFNHDDWLDLAVVGSGSNASLQIFLNDGESGGGTSFTPGTPVATGLDSPSALAIDDFNGDGKSKPDIAVVNQAIASGTNSSTVAFFLGDGQGDLVPAPDACGLPTLLSAPASSVQRRWRLHSRARRNKHSNYPALPSMAGLLTM